MMYKNLLDAIGNTPLVRIPFKSNATICAKLEYLNPGGSLKDRSARYMIEEAEKKGLLKPGGTLIEATSGNQGIAIAMIGAAKGYQVIITTSEKISREKLMTLKAYGAYVIVCPMVDGDDPRNYHTVAEEIQRNTPNSFMPNQYFNVSNAHAHYTITGPEIWQQTEGKITHFFAAAGTGGMISGVGQYLKEKNSNIKIIAADSDVSYRSTKGHPKPYYVEGMGVDYDTPVVNYDVIDEFVEVSDEQSFSVLQPMAREYGLLVGLSSGAVIYMVQQYLKKLHTGDLAVMIFGDSGRAYLSKNLYGNVEADEVRSLQDSVKPARARVQRN